MITRRGFGLGAATLGLAACSQTDTDDAPGEITFCVPASGRLTRRQIDWRPLFADMEAATGLKVRPFLATSDAIQLDAMKHRRVDAGWFSNEAALAAVRSADGEVFARTIPPSGGAGYRSVLIAASKGSVTLDRLGKCDRTLRYGQAAVTSTAGYLAPLAFFFGPNKLDPAKCFKLVSTGDIEANLAAVAGGTLDVAASDSALLDRLTQAGDPRAAKLEVIWASPDLAEDPILCRKNLDPELKEKLRQFFITDARGDTAGAQAQRDHLNPLDIGGFEPADNSHLLLAREIEARVRWAQATWSGDAARIEASRKAMDAIIAERQAVQLAPGAAQ